MLTKLQAPGETNTVIPFLDELLAKLMDIKDPTLHQVIGQLLVGTGKAT